MRGADIFISYLNEDENAQDTVAWVEKAGRKATAFKGDITSEDHCIAMVDRAVNDFGELDVLVNNAAARRR